MTDQVDPSQESYYTRLSRITSRAQTLNDICVHCAAGGTLVTLSESWNVRYADLCQWINQDKDRFEAYRLALNDRTEWVKETVLAELRMIALSDLREAFNANGTLKDIKDLPKSIARAIASVEVEDLFAGKGEERVHIGYTKKVKFWDKTKSIEMVMKNLGLLVERHVFQGVKLEDLLAASREEPKQIPAPNLPPPENNKPDEETNTPAAQ